MVIYFDNYNFDNYRQLKILFNVKMERCYKNQQRTKVACLPQVFDVLLLVFIYLKKNISSEMPLQADRSV